MTPVPCLYTGMRQILHHCQRALTNRTSATMRGLFRIRRCLNGILLSALTSCLTVMLLRSSPPSPATSPACKQHPNRRKAETIFGKCIESALTDSVQVRFLKEDPLCLLTAQVLICTCPMAQRNGSYPQRIVELF